MNGFIVLIHRLFIPGETNNYRARSLHHDYLSAFLILALTFVFFTKTGSNQLSNILGFATDITTNKLLELTNQERFKNNLTTLSYNEILAKAAQKKAQDMLSKNYWAHYAPDGKTPWNFMYESGYKYEYAGENLAKNFLFSQNVVDAWMKSPSHRDNLLRREYTEVGFAIINGVLNGEETTLVVQMFGKPSNNQVAANTNTEIPLEINSDLAGLQIQKTAVNSSKTSFNLFFVYIIFLAAVLISDLYFAKKLNIIRFHAKNVFHLIFIFFMALGVGLFLIKGSIL